MADKPTSGFVVLEGRDAGRIVPLTASPFILGRQLDSQFVLADEQVSRRHAQVEKTSNNWILMDLNSRNGVFVDDQKVQRHVLSSGDQVRLGNTVLLFHSDLTRAREVMSQSIPDSEVFAIQRDSAEEPTRAEYDPSAVPPSSQASSGGDKTIRQLLNLFKTQASMKGCATSVLDLVFQSFAPDRAQIIWKGEESIELSRTKSEGRLAKSFAIPPELLRKPAGVSTHIVMQGRKVLFGSLPNQGGLYIDRGGQEKDFTPGEKENFDLILDLLIALAGHVALTLETKNLREHITKMEKHVSPEVSRMIRGQKTTIDENEMIVSERDVTVLFCDIKGFTQLSERLSPQQLAQLLNEYFQRMVDCIHQNNGHLNKFIGDAVMAVFGAPESHGNDAANAVSAALTMIEELKKFWTEISEEKRFSIRIGINTGKAIAGNIGSQKKMEYTVLGDIVNIASRLEGVSPANEITIGPETAARVASLYELKEMPPVQVKGKSSVIHIYRVLSKK